MQLPDFKNIPILGFPLKWLQGNDMDYGLHVTLVAGVILYLSFSLSPTLMQSSFSFFFNLAPIWLPFMIFAIFLYRWMDFIGKRFLLSLGRVTYRIKLPPEVQKSPEAMEFVLNQIWNKQTVDNLWQAYIDGKRPLPYGLEIVSIGGDVRFYINIYRKKVVEALLPALYSQYPGIEVIEEPVDYAAEVPVGDPEWDIFSIHLNKKEKKYAPIKTYIDWKLDTMPKEEEKIDPITPLLERLAEIGPNERLYYQFLITTFRKQSFTSGDFWNFKETDDWSKEAHAHIDELMQRDPKTKAPVSPEGSDFDGMPRITPGERDTVAALERNAEKYCYKTGIRILYLAKKGHFRSTIINPSNRVLAQWDMIGRASIGVRWRTDFNYMWFSDPFGDRLKAIKQQEHREYKMRKFVPKSQNDMPKYFTTEELASIFHIPGKVALTPTLERIPSTRSQAPANLPVGKPQNI